MRPDHQADAIRWEALSHAQIYRGVHMGQDGAAPSLAETLPLWRESVADLGELRSRYEAAVARLLSVSSGANADAAAAASRLVTRGLTDAQELTELARARRARLDARNERLRRSMPEPTAPAEHSSGFLLGGHGWLLPPDFEREDAARINAGEVARDQMREYERDIATDTLADDETRWREPPVGHPADPFDEPTVQLSGTVAAKANAATVVDVPQQGAWSDDRADQSFGMGGRARGSGPHELDFGPRGHTHLDEDLFGGDDEPTVVLGSPPPPRVAVAEPPRRGPDNPFEPDDRGFPSVIGI